MYQERKLRSAKNVNPVGVDNDPYGSEESNLKIIKASESD